MRGFIFGFFTALALIATAAEAGIISHVVAYSVGKSAGKKEAVKQNPCDEQKKSGGVE